MARIYQLDTITPTSVTYDFVIPIEDSAGANTRRLTFQQLTEYLFDVANNTENSNGAFGGVKLAIGEGSNLGSSSESSVVGVDNYAMNTRNSAYGYDNTATGNWGASAFGYRNSALSSQSVAFGHKNFANDYDASALGSENDAVGESSTAVGSNNTATGYGSIAAGYSNGAYGTYATTVGSNNETGSYASTCVGYSNYCNDDHSTAIGYNNYTGGDSSTAIGYSNNASGIYATALGYDNTTNGISATAVGNSCSAGGARSSAIGYEANARQDETVVIGQPIINQWKNDANSFGVSVVIMSKSRSLLETCQESVTVNGTFYVEEVGVIIDSYNAVTIQPTVNFGYVGNTDGYVADVLTTDLTDVNTRARYTSLLEYNGHDQLYASVTVAGTGVTLVGRFYWKGLFVENPI